jgi:hypothetical protein
MEKSPLNFGFGGGMGAFNAVQPQMPWNDSQFNGNIASWVTKQAQTQNQPNPFAGPQIAASAAATQDPNNLSATGIGVPNTTYSSMDPLSPEASGVATDPNIANNAVGVGGISTTVGTGSFSPQVQNVAQGVYGDKNMRDASVQKRKLINLI